MRVLVIGSGAREHALVLALSRDPGVTAVLAAPGNAGIAQIAEQFPVDAASAEQVVALAKEQNVDLVVIGPEVPLVLGVADAVRAAGIACFGPSAAAAATSGRPLDEVVGAVQAYLSRRPTPAASPLPTGQPRRD